ncbi:MAG: hypothetical protein WBR18_03045 [Anaerolineales bacterium]
MRWTELIKELLEPIGGREAEFVHIRCDRCGELLQTRIDLTHDLSADYNSNGYLKGYFTHKTVIGDGPCFQHLDVHIRYDTRRRRKEITVSGGQALSADEFERLSKGTEKETDKR